MFIVYVCRSRDGQWIQEYKYRDIQGYIGKHNKIILKKWVIFLEPDGLRYNINNIKTLCWFCSKRCSTRAPKGILDLRAKIPRNGADDEECQQYSQWSQNSKLE